MVRLHDKNLDGDSRDSGELFWLLSDAQFSTVAVIDKNAVLQERVSYTSYGVGTHRWPHEVNNTGGVTTKRAHGAGQSRKWAKGRFIRS